MDMRKGLGKVLIEKNIQTYMKYIKAIMAMVPG
jgi:hypothetical protein